VQLQSWQGLSSQQGSRSNRNPTVSVPAHSLLDSPAVGMQARRLPALPMLGLAQPSVTCHQQQYGSLCASKLTRQQRQLQ
jgi:hypothetical protein